MSPFRSPLLYLLLTIILIAGLTMLGPEEKTLGSNVRIVYLHGAWVMAAEITLGLAALTGLFGVIFQKPKLNRWSTALGRTGLIFWLTYLPLSLWAMQVNWNGLFLSEPRFRIATIFAICGLLLQVGLALLAKPFFTSISNVLFFILLRIGLAQAGYLMHPPPSPIFNSGILYIELYFVGLTLITLIGAWFLTQWWLGKV